MHIFNHNSPGSSANHGWVLEEKEIEIEWATMKPAPDHLLEFVNCGCKTGCDSNSCGCNRANLQCTELCKYRTDCNNATIDSEDEIFSNVYEDDLNDDDEQY